RRRKIIMALSAASFSEPSAPQLTTEQFYSALDQLTTALSQATTLEEARQFTTRLQYLQQEKKPTTNKNFSMTYHVYWDLCEQLNISHGESDFYQYLNAHCQRDQGNIVKMSLRRLAKKARIGRETLDRYLEKLAKIGWIIVKRIPKGGTISVTIQVTTAIREANEKRNVEKAERKANLKTMLK